MRGTVAEIEQPKVGKWSATGIRLLIDPPALLKIPARFLLRRNDNSPQIVILSVAKYPAEC